MNEQEKLSNIAEVALLRTGLVRIIPHGKDLDFIAYYVHDPQKIVGVEVKLIQFNSEAALKKSNELENKMKSLQSTKNIPIVLFLIDMQKESGFFRIFDRNSAGEIFPLNIDILLRKLAVSLKVDMPIEYPPYKFYQRGKESKHETAAIPVDDKFTTLRLYNAIVNPFTAKEHLELEIIISAKTSGDTGYYSYNQQLNDLFVNQKLSNYVFFVNKDIAHTDITLPKDVERITFKMKSSNHNEDYECTLSCEYLTKSEAQHIEKI